ncbi:hypothetical protein DFH11DRAFT_250442 [Phellopilus nigrolimitatus]|nr:hypothetical protein DFH11DRAFT_250442 [Phellopilus nigrolimitatus]
MPYLSYYKISLSSCRFSARSLRFLSSTVCLLAGFSFRPGSILVLGMSGWNWHLDEPPFSTSPSERPDSQPDHSDHSASNGASHNREHVFTRADPEDRLVQVFASSDFLNSSRDLNTTTFDCYSPPSTFLPSFSGARPFPTVEESTQNSDDSVTWSPTNIANPQPQTLNHGTHSHPYHSSEILAPRPIPPTFNPNLFGEFLYSSLTNGSLQPRRHSGDSLYHPDLYLPPRPRDPIAATLDLAEVVELNAPRIPENNRLRHENFDLEGLSGPSTSTSRLSQGSRKPANRNPCRLCRGWHVKCDVVATQPFLLCGQCEKKGYVKCDFSD